jgi:hypothetical protein
VAGFPDDWLDSVASRIPERDATSDTNPLSSSNFPKSAFTFSFKAVTGERQKNQQPRKMRITTREQQRRAGVCVWLTVMFPCNVCNELELCVALFKNIDSFLQQQVLLIQYMMCVTSL